MSSPLIAPHTSSCCEPAGGSVSPRSLMRCKFVLGSILASSWRSFWASVLGGTDRISSPARFKQETLPSLDSTSWMITSVTR